MQNANMLVDAAIVASRALPSSTSAVTSGAIDLQNSANADFSADVAFDLAAPAVTTGQLPDTKTFTYSIVHSVNADLSSPATLIANAIVQTGAAGAGAAAASYRFRVPNTVRRYLGFAVTPSAGGTGDASGASSTLTPKF